MEFGLRGRHIAVLAADGVARAELLEPWHVLEDQGAKLELIAPRKGEIRTSGAEQGEKVPVHHSLDEADASGYDALLIPGGEESAGALAGDERALAFVRTLVDGDKPVATISEGARLLVAADLVRGRTITARKQLAKSIREAGGDWIDKAVQVDQKLITTRGEEDLPLLCAKIVREFSNRMDEAKVDSMVEQTFPASDPLPGPVAIGEVGSPAAGRPPANDRGTGGASAGRH